MLQEDDPKALAPSGVIIHEKRKLVGNRLQWGEGRLFADDLPLLHQPSPAQLSEPLGQSQGPVPCSAGAKDAIELSILGNARKKATRLLWTDLRCSWLFRLNLEAPVAVLWYWSI